MAEDLPPPPPPHHHHHHQQQAGQKLSPALLQGSEAAALQHKIKSSICKSIQSKVDSILQDVEKFTDIEKLYLYLKLPSGSNNGNDKSSDQSSISSSRTQQTHAFSWIQNHLEEHPDTSLPKQEVYDEYKSYCDNLGYHPLSAADFGKIMKNVFPNMKARRLGMRGKSKYCYSGLRKKAFVHMPSLPNLDFRKTGDGSDMLESFGMMPSAGDEVRLAACGLVCEWAQKVLSQQFDNVEDLARFLLTSHYIGTKSMAALTVMTGTPTGMKTPTPASAFIPTLDATTFQPQVKTLASPSVDAKQQLQRKIQKKQQEQKLQSPLPAEAQTRRSNGGGTPVTGASVPCGSPALLSPQSTIGIVVTAVPSPITVQRGRQIMSSPNPVSTTENKVLPVNFQVVSQSIQPVKQSPKTPQNVSASPVGERLSSRHRYHQILPKPPVSGALTLRSPPTLLITNSALKTVVPSPHVAPVNVVKMTAVSLSPSGSTNSTPVRSTPASLNTSPEEILSSHDSPSSFTNSLQSSPPVKPTQIATSTTVDVKMEPEGSIYVTESLNGRINTTHECVEGQKCERGTKPRAASVPTSNCKGFAGHDGMSRSKCREKSPSAKPLVGSVRTNNSDSSDSPLYLTISTHNTSNSLSPVSMFASTSPKSPRKRPGISLESHAMPVKKVFITQQPVGRCCDSPKVQHGSPARKKILRASTQTRPESAPASTCGKVMVKLNPVPNEMLSLSDLPLESSISKTVKGQEHFQKGDDQSLEPLSISTAQSATLTTLDVSTVEDLKSSMWADEQLESIELSAYEEQIQSPRETVETQVPSSSELHDVEFVHSQTSVDCFPFNDDDMTQDSIVEELVQMEEQMKLNNVLQSYGNGVNVSLKGQSIAGQSASSFYHSLHNNATPTPNPTSTPTPTATPTSEVMGSGLRLTRESPCSQLAPVTPLDGTLASTHHTPLSTPHSNCSSSVPPSPVDSCRNPFAFTPINSSITTYHDTSIVSSSPLKPMQRPTATHPDKTKLEWMNNGYNNGGCTSAVSSNCISIIPSYQDLVDDHFRKPHAFAIPTQSYQSQTKHHDGQLGRVTPVSPVQQQLATSNTLVKQEGFVVPAPLDKTTGSSMAGILRCRSVSPAVRQRNSSDNASSPVIARSVVSPFNSTVTPVVLNTLAVSHMDTTVGLQRSQSVPLSVMMQSELNTSSNTKITSVLLSKMDPEGDDDVRGLGLKNIPSYTARLNLAHILETTSNAGTNNQVIIHHHPSQSLSPNPSHFQTTYLMTNDRTEQSSTLFPQTEVGLSSQNHQHLDLSVRDLLEDDDLTPDTQLVSQVTSDINESDFSGDIGLTAELTSSINDLNTLDASLLFDPSRQQGHYEDPTLEELKDDHLFQQICTETVNSGSFDWLESKDQPTVEMLG